ncbi:DUF1707 domain-containing protein [Nocardia uniformis]|uniref:DUF1707 domain-containing protein n=1 Tax=Nocardia uniformis TaxID=53432 RepID=A0A849C1K1_9NOCA|nr:DUF1707 domain-containing protein [Nocardia uniformis]NNH68879.1 DUF1707 domain-containing protein [Nocardia uniformis]
MAEPDDLLLSHDERTHALDALAKHYADGRLDSAEFYERSGAVASARTFGALDAEFSGLPGGVPLTWKDGLVVRVPIPSDTGEVTGGAPTAAVELSALRARGQIIESLDAIILGITLVSFLVLQLIVGWSFAWIIWPSLIVTLTIPRMVLRFSESDEEVYEDLKEAEAEARKQRLAEAANRIRELGSGQGTGS